MSRSTALVMVAVLAATGLGAACLSARGRSTGGGNAVVERHRLD